MDKNNLNNLIARNNATSNKPSEDDVKSSNNIFQHTSGEVACTLDVQINQLIDLFASLYLDKWDSNVNMNGRDFKLTEIKTFMTANGASIPDMVEYIKWLFRGRLNRKFKGSIGCIDSQKMYDDWKDKEMPSIGTSAAKFNVLKNSGKTDKVTKDYRIFLKYATDQEKIDYDKYMSFDYDGDDHSWWQRTLTACKSRITP